MNIVCLDGYTLNPGDNSWDEVKMLGNLTVYDRTPVEHIIERAVNADIILTNKCPINAETLAALPKLRCISVLATGFNVVDVVAAKACAITVCNVPVYGTDTVAEFVFSLILNYVRNPQQHSDAVHGGQWCICPDFCFWNTPQLELRDKTLSIIGFGRIGRRIGEIGHVFGMRILAVSNSRSQTAAYPFSWVTLEQAFAEGDFVSLSCPQTSDNTGMVNMALLTKMKPSAYFINTARGGLVNEADLATALATGTLAGAAVDVISVEPMKPKSTLLGAKNLIITPHIAWATQEARKRLMQTTVDNIIAFQKGTPQNIVNL